MLWMRLCLLSLSRLLLCLSFCFPVYAQTLPQTDRQTVAQATTKPNTFPYDPLNTPAMLVPKASSAWLMDVAVHGQRVLMVGEYGVALYADVPALAHTNAPKGVQWQQAKVPVSLTLTAVAFASPHVAYAVGHDGVVLKSEDAGASWRLVFDGNQANAQVVQAAQLRLSQAQQTLKQSAIEEAELALDDAQAGARFGPSRPFLGVWFRNALQGWVVGSYGQLFYTQDGGKRWALQTQGLDNPDARHFNSIVGNDQGLVLIAAEAGCVYRSTNYGATWQRLETGYTGPWFGALPLPGGGVLAYGLNGHVAVQNKPQGPWQRVLSPSQYSMVAAVPNAQGALLVNQKGQLFMYEPADELAEQQGSQGGSMRALPALNLASGFAATSATKTKTKTHSSTTALAMQGQAFWLAGQGGPRGLFALP